MIFSDGRREALKGLQEFFSGFRDTVCYIKADCPGLGKFEISVNGGRPAPPPLSAGEGDVPVAGIIQDSGGDTLPPDRPPADLADLEGHILANQAGRRQ